MLSTKTRMLNAGDEKRRDLQIPPPVHEPGRVVDEVSRGEESVVELARFHAFQYAVPVPPMNATTRSMWWPSAREVPVPLGTIRSPERYSET